MGLAVKLTRAIERRDKRGQQVRKFRHGTMLLAGRSAVGQPARALFYGIWKD
jgi:hypothetical protein